MTTLLLLVATTLTLPAWGNGAPDLLIDVPNGYQLQRKKGPDFDVFYISSKESGGSLGIYVGHHPDAHGTPRSSGVANIHWSPSEDVQGEHKVYKADAVLEDVFAGYSGPGVEELLLHVFVRGLDRKVVETLQSAAATIRTAETTE